MSVALSERELYDLSAPGLTIDVDLTGRAATLLVGHPEDRVRIEMTPTGELPGDYFVGTFDGPRIVAIVRLSEDYDTVREIDLVHMVGADRDVHDFPRIAVVRADGARKLQIVGGGSPACLELCQLPELAQQAA